MWTVNVSISDSWDNFDVSFGGDFGWLSDGILPQVQDSLPENLKEKVEALAGKCKNLLDSILKALGEKKVESFDFGKLFDRVGGKNISINASKFPKNKDGTENTAMGTSEKEVWSNRRININPAHIPISGREGHIVGVVLQELLHHARSSGLFEDEDLDNAALSLMTSKEQATRKAYMAKKGYKAGSVGHGFVNGNCINKP